MTIDGIKLTKAEMNTAVVQYLGRQGLNLDVDNILIDTIGYPVTGYQIHFGKGPAIVALPEEIEPPPLTTPELEKAESFYPTEA